ncbi:hypothetical protein [Arthrobacter monumenti]
MTTYGWEPATAILIGPDKVGSNTVLVDRGGALSHLPQDKECVNGDDANLSEAGISRT